MNHKYFVHVPKWCLPWWHWQSPDHFWGSLYPCFPICLNLCVSSCAPDFLVSPLQRYQWALTRDSFPNSFMLMLPMWLRCIPGKVLSWSPHVALRENPSECISAWLPCSGSFCTLSGRYPGSSNCLQAHMFVALLYTSCVIVIIDSTPHFLIIVLYPAHSSVNNSFTKPSSNCQFSAQLCPSLPQHQTSIVCQFPVCLPYILLPAVCFTQCSHNAHLTACEIQIWPFHPSLKSSPVVTQ